MVIDFSGILVNYWYMIIGAVAAIYAVFKPGRPHQMAELNTTGSYSSSQS
jgi:hypothetical protein